MIRSPVRRLYDELVALDGGDASILHENLVGTHDDYRAMVGRGEARFCEWAYHRLEQRALVSGLIAGAVRRKEAKSLALGQGVDAGLIDALDTDTLLRKSLALLGVREPALPQRLVSGVESLREARDFLDAEIYGRPQAHLPGEPHPVEPLARCRRGAERFLKLQLRFLWDGGASTLIERVARDRLHGYNQRPVGVLEEFLRVAELGSLNHLLRAVAREIEVSGHRLPYQPVGSIWSDATFDAVARLARSLNPEFHDRPAVHRQEQFLAISAVLSRIEGQDGLRLPRAIQFFRRYDDGHAHHYEGFTSDGAHLKLYEVEAAYELHTSYLFVAATNPSAVDVVCTPFPPEFAQPL